MPNFAQENKTKKLSDIKKYTDDTMKNLTIFCVVMILLGACKRKSFEEIMEQQAIETTEKQCPREIAPCMRIDSLVFDKQTRTMHYYYTVMDKLDNEDYFKGVTMEEFHDNMLIRLRDDLSLKKEKENEVNFSYHYISKTKKKELYNIVLTPKEYTGKINVKSFDYLETQKLKEFTRTSCPMRQDICTTLDSMCYDSISRTIYYNYSVEGELDEDSVYLDTDKIHQLMRAQLIPNIINNPDIATERDKEKLNFCFKYYSSTTKQLYIEEYIKNEEVKQPLKNNQNTTN